MATNRHKHLIDLTPAEAGILSFVAEYAHAVSAHTQLKSILLTSTKRAQTIGAVMLGKSNVSRPSITFMAQRFLRAAESNARNSAILFGSGTGSGT